MRASRATGLLFKALMGSFGIQSATSPIVFQEQQGEMEHDTDGE
jgi:hypothetical protein